ncbi:hypothetical protein [Silvanigrella aquatica]|uniref:Uncharacterized protein n=1 Tax=Silvanigrella aquatica TaxID=1915309 RepID=A0A1L4D0B8_9BACT|nr:hypothetical protein [Silvanigrella aquatica]APJ03630.1 hypothetical protein AXG55_06805 [Silvanigrella aquatica]
MQNPVYMQLNVGANEANRLYWHGQYYSLEVVLVFPKQVESKDEMQKNLELSTLVLKLTPFKNHFRAKMLASLTSQENVQQSNIIGLTVTINIRTLKILEILDTREIATTLDGEGSGSIQRDESHQIKLSDKENSSLIEALEKLAEGNLMPHLRQPFISFFPDFVDDQWQERIPKRQKKSALVPFQAVFPYAGSIERSFENKMFAMDDLYCVNPECDCSEVTCVVLTFDPETGREITHGGFKYNLDKKTFKAIPNFPSSFNSQEWFKQFSKQNAIQLQLAFQARYDFLRERIK